MADPLLYSKPLQIEGFKSDNEDWLVEGYVSTFGNVDRGDDIVMAGAFDETLKSGPKVKFLLSHDPTKVLGIPTKLKEDKKGLFGSFKISKTTLGADTHQLLLDGALDSFSIGYRAKVWEWDTESEVRKLVKIELYEASLVPIPMNPQAEVTRVKDLTGGTLTERMKSQAETLKQLLEDIRGLAGKGHSLNETKRQELTVLLEMFSGMDDVRSGIQSVLTAASPTGLVSAKRTSYELARARERLANILNVQE